jgi:hypothetical protein
MNFNKVAEEILFFEFVTKLSGLDIKNRQKEINQLFTEYIKSPKLFNGKLYMQLDTKEKEKVWIDFWKQISGKYNEVEKIVEETLKSLQKTKQPA